jgi:hypothetical protein
MEQQSMTKYLFLILLLFSNCNSLQKQQDLFSQNGEDMLCDEENHNDCKYQFENY